MDKFFNDHRENAACRSVQQVDVKFRADGLTRILPAIYHFDEGIVFDILTIMDESLLEAYYEKYKWADENPGSLSEIQIAKISQECPYQPVQFRKVYMNDSVEIKSHAFHDLVRQIPCLNEPADSTELQNIKEAYAAYLADVDCFFCQRFQIVTKELWTEDAVAELTVETCEQSRTEEVDLTAEVYPGEEKCMEFSDPFTGAKHKIYIYDVEEVKAVPEGIGCYMGKMEIVPELSKEEKILFDATISYQRMKGSTGASAVSVIGGSSGPVSVFLAGKVREEESRFGGTPKPCFSKPFMAGEQEKSCFIISGVERLVQDSEKIQLIGGQDESFSCC